MSDAAGQTVGDRLYLIRLACGDGFRKPEPIPLFVARVKQQTGTEYHEGTISLLERMKQKWRVEDVETLAQVDPLERGSAWLAFNIAAPESGAKDHPRVTETTERETVDPQAGQRGSAARQHVAGRRRPGK